MSGLKTYGRYPSLGEVKEYYSRKDITEFLYYACKKRKVILSFRDEPSPNSEAKTPPLKPENIEELHQIIMDGIAAHFQGIPDNERLSAYPSFHGWTAKDGDVTGDFVLEADCNGWRRSFVDVRGVIEILSEFQVPHIAKFSGHRSLHVMIPREALPQEFEEVPIEKAWKSLERRLNAFFTEHAKVISAHGTGGLLRLPYSLNENTGLVSLPIKPERLDNFRPWEAIPHLVENVIESPFDISPNDKEKVRQFLETALIHKQIKPITGNLWCIKPKEDMDSNSIAEGSTTIIEAYGSDNPYQRAEAAWRLMIKGDRVPDEIFNAYANEENADARWFIAEALMGDERAMELMSEMDEYAANAISDSVSMFAVPFLRKMLDEDIDWRESPGITENISSIAERSAPELREEIVQQAEGVRKEEISILMGFASILGGTESDWDTVNKAVSILAKRFPNTREQISQDVFINIRKLQIDNANEREKAVEGLIAAGKRATDALTLAMGNAEHWMRKSIISILCKIGDPKAMPTLVNALGDPGGKVRRIATNGLLKLKEKPDKLRDLLVKAAEVDNPRLRANATKVLRLIDEAAALEIALKSIQDKDPKVRQAGIKALGKIGGKQSIETLAESINDKNQDVALQAAFALAETGAKGIAALKSALVETETQAARCAAHALLEIGDNSGIELVIEALNDDEWTAWCTPFSLSKSGDKRAMEALTNLIEDSLHTEEISGRALQAIKALGNIPGSLSLDILKRVIYTRDDRYSRRAGVMALRTMGTPEATDMLLELLVDKNGNLRQHAGNVLRKMGPEIIPRLEDMAEQVEGKLRRSVDNVLKNLHRLNG